MANEDIKRDLLKIFDILLLKFPTVEIKYEYSDDYACYIASLNIDALDEATLDEFCVYYMREIELIQHRYGDDAPLFCMNEEWFKLSPEAIAYSYYNNIIDSGWCDDITEYNFNTAKYAVSVRKYNGIPLAA